MNIKIQKILVIIFYLISISSFVYGLTFMTNYYHLYAFGTSDMGDMYNWMQIFNKNYFIESIYAILFSVFLFVTGTGKNIVNNFVYGVVAIMALFLSYTAVGNIADLQFLKSLYLTFDYSTVHEYTPSTMWFDAGVVICALIVVVSILTLTFVSINKFKKVEVN